jgi:hypothetical protein
MTDGHSKSVSKALTRLPEKLACRSNRHDRIMGMESMALNSRNPVVRGKSRPPELRP